MGFGSEAKKVHLLYLSLVLNKLNKFSFFMCFYSPPNSSDRWGPDGLYLSVHHFSPFSFLLDRSCPNNIGGSVGPLMRSIDVVEVAAKVL